MSIVGSEVVKCIVFSMICRGQVCYGNVLWQHFLNHSLCVCSCVDQRKPFNGWSQSSALRRGSLEWRLNVDNSLE